MKLFFTIVYFFCLSKVTAWLFNRLNLPLSTVDVLFLFALLMVLIISVGFAEFTVRKIRNHYKRHSSDVIFPVANCKYNYLSYDLGHAQFV